MSRYRGLSSARQLWDFVRAGSILLVVLAIVLQSIESASHGKFRATRFFAYFTIQSNLIGAASLSFVLARGRNHRDNRTLQSLRGAAAVYLTVTFLVVILLLRQVEVGLALPWVDFVLHQFFPAIVVIDWFIEPPVGLKWRDAARWMLYPLAWLLCTLVRGSFDRWYPYPFLNPTIHGWGSVGVAIAGITLGFLLLAGCYIGLANLRNAYSRPAPAAGTQS